MLIYEPKGKAREYSPLALNIYKGCDHGCKYCYVQYIEFTSVENRKNVSERSGIIESLAKELSKISITKQVLLCFTGDPYCQANDKFKLTRKIIIMLRKAGIPVSILSKGGFRILQDIDILSNEDKIKIGMTLTFDNDKDSIKTEPGASMPQERIDTLSTLHANGIKTWVSIEPVIIPSQSMNMIERSLPFVDEYMIGKWNHDIDAKNINWKSFVTDAIRVMRRNNKPYYIKEDLRPFIPPELYDPEDMILDKFAMTANPKKKLRQESLL